MRTFGQVRDRPFNVFRSDGKLLVRSTRFQRQEGKAGLRLNCGQETFADCTEGTLIWLRLRPDNDVEIQIDSPPGPIIDAELNQDCGSILEDPNLENYWQVVNSACTILETRLRSLSQAPNTLIGVRLVEYALNQKDGILICRDHEAEQKGFYELCRGIFQAYRNPTSHRKIEFSRTRARQIVGIIDVILAELDVARTRE